MTITDALQTVTWNVVRKLNVYYVKRSNPHGTLSQTSETDCVNGRDTVSVESLSRPNCLSGERGT
jgi:hypothetical protein